MALIYSVSCCCSFSLYTTRLPSKKSPLCLSNVISTCSFEYGGHTRISTWSVPLILVLNCPRSTAPNAGARSYRHSVSSLLMIFSAFPYCPTSPSLPKNKAASTKSDGNPKPYKHDTEATMTGVLFVDFASTKALVARCRNASKSGSTADLFSTYRPPRQLSGM